MAEFDAAAFVADLERLGVKLTAVQLADGRLRVNRWRMLEAVANAERIESLWASRIGGDQQLLDRVAAYVLTARPRAAPGDTAPVHKSVEPGSLAADAVKAPLPQTHTPSVALNTSVASQTLLPGLQKSSLAPPPTSLASQRLVSPAANPALPRSAASLQKSAAALPKGLAAPPKRTSILSGAGGSQNPAGVLARPLPKPPTAIHKTTAAPTKTPGLQKAPPSAPAAPLPKGPIGFHKPKTNPRP